jgi:hypothetical protein
MRHPLRPSARSRCDILSGPLPVQGERLHLTINDLTIKQGKTVGGLGAEALGMGRCSDSATWASGLGLGRCGGSAAILAEGEGSQ